MRSSMSCLRVDGCRARKMKIAARMWRLYVRLPGIRRARVRFVICIFFEAAFFKAAFFKAGGDVEVGGAVQTLQVFALEAVGLEFLEFQAGAAVFAAVA